MSALHVDLWKLILVIGMGWGVAVENCEAENKKGYKPKRVTF
jgi:hypothetical protein